MGGFHFKERQWDNRMVLPVIEYNQYNYTSNFLDQSRPFTSIHNNQTSNITNYYQTSNFITSNINITNYYQTSNIYNYYYSSNNSIDIGGGVTEDSSSDDEGNNDNGNNGNGNNGNGNNGNGNNGNGNNGNQE